MPEIFTVRMAKMTKCDKVTMANDKNVGKSDSVDSDKSKYNPQIRWWLMGRGGVWQGVEGMELSLCRQRSSWAPYTAVELGPVSVSPGCLRDLHPDPG